MKHIKSETVVVELTQEEAKIIQCLLALKLEDDPYGDTSKRLDVNLTRVIRVSEDFEKVLFNAIQ